MRRKINYYRLVWLKYDLPAGLSVFFVALPLCLGIALASGVPLYSGLLSGIIGGIVVPVISRSPLSVSGPAAGLTTVVSAALLTLGDFNLFMLSVIVAGFFQVLLGVLKMGGIANYFPSSVIKGMLTAIGILLISKQIPIALGYDQPDFWASGFLKLFKEHNFFGSIEYFHQHLTIGAILIAVSSFIIMAVLQKPFAKQLKIVPATLLVVVISVVVNIIFYRSTSHFSLKPTQLVSIPSNIFAEIRFADFSQLFSTSRLWENGLIIGLLATLETLLGVEAVDKLDKHNRITPVNRELIAQGIGNIFCGLTGALPITAVVVRGAANIEAGARTRLSAFTHGMFLVVAVLLFPFLLNQIPYAALAAILLITGYNLARPSLFINQWKLGLKQFLPFIITIGVILVTDLLMGVSIGLLLSIYFIIQNNFKTEYKITQTVQDGVETYLIRLTGNVTFLNKVQLRKTLDQIPEDSVLTIDGSRSDFIDYDILEIISEYYSKAEDRNIRLILKGIERVTTSAIH